MKKQFKKLMRKYLTLCANFNANNITAKQLNEKLKILNATAIQIGFLK